MLSSEWHLICTFLAVVCSSWTPVNRGSTGRSIMTPLGCEDYPHVRKSNKLTSRTRIFFKAHKFHHEFINFYSIKKAVTNYKMYLFLVDPTLGTYMIEFMHDHYIYIYIMSTNNCHISFQANQDYTRISPVVSAWILQKFSLCPLQECDPHVDDGAHGRFVLPRESSQLTGGLPPEVRVDVGTAQGVQSVCSLDGDRH